MLIKPKTLVLHAMSVLVGTMLCISCANSSLDLDAEAQAQSFSKAQSDAPAPPSERAVDESEPSSSRPPRSAIYPAKMDVSMNHVAQTMTVEVTFDACKEGGFVYEKNSLDVEFDHADKSVTLRGVVDYIERAPVDPAMCETPPEPLVFVSENAAPGAYLIANVSAWMGRAGNGIEARVEDFRTPPQVETDRHNCRSQSDSEIGNISGVWFLQSDPTRTMTLSGNETMLTPDSVLRTWVGSYRPWVIEADAPYTFDLPPFGLVVFESASCALIYPPHTDEPTDTLIRQTPVGLKEK